MIPRRDGETARLHLAEEELRRVVGSELARLIADAALLRAEYAPFGSLVPELVRRPTYERWALEAQRALALARSVAATDAETAALGGAAQKLEGLGVTGLELAGLGLAGQRLAELRSDRSRGASWPRASTLAREARRLARSDVRVLVVAQALLAEGRPARARALLTGLLGRDPADEIRWRALQGVAAAHEASGNDRLALAAYGGAARVASVGAAPLAEGLFLALSRGGVQRARDLGARLEASLEAAPWNAAEFERSLARLERRCALRERPAPPRAALARSWSVTRRGAVAAVAELVVGGRE